MTRATVAMLIAFAAISAAAQNVGTEEFLRQQERERQQRIQQEKTPDVRLQQQETTRETPLIQNETPCFVIRHIDLTGELAERFRFSLAAVLEGDNPAIGKCLGAQGINGVLSRVQDAVVTKGYVTTRILAAPQDIKSGNLILTVIPGRVRNIRFTPDSSPRGTQWNALPIRSGDILNLRDIEQGLENFKRVPTAEADIRIEPAEGDGAEPGESDLVIAYKQAFPFRLTLSADDSGSKATGKYQGSVTLSHDNWFTLNDLFYASFNHDLGGGDDGDRGTRGSTVYYSVPFGYWAVGLTANRYRYYQSVAGVNQTYIYSGASDNSDIRISRLVYRDAVRKTTVSLRGYLKESNNFIDDTEVEVQKRRMAGWELSVAHREFIGAASLDLNLAYVRGTGAFHALEAPEDAFGEGASRPEIWNADATLTVPFQLAQQSLRYTGAVRAQYNKTPLVPQDRFSIGGRYTVRGFDGENVLSADRGWLLRNDLALALGGSGQEVYAGLDYGEVDGPSSKFLIGKHLAGVVLGLRGGYANASYDFFVGQPVSRPDGFKTASTTAGFNLSWTF